MDHIENHLIIAPDLTICLLDDSSTFYDGTFAMSGRHAEERVKAWLAKTLAKIEVAQEWLRRRRIEEKKEAI